MSSERPDSGESPSRAVQQWDPVAGEPKQGPAAEVSVADGKPVWSWPDTPLSESSTVLPATAAAHGAPPVSAEPGTPSPAPAEAASSAATSMSDATTTTSDATSMSDATTTVDTRHYARERRLERRVMVLSTVLGTLGLAVAFAAAGLDQLRYNQPGPCAAYATAHQGHQGFGCSAAAKHIAVIVPAVGIIVLVVAALAVVWIPQRSPNGRLAWLSGYVVLLVLAALAVAIAYSALPQTG